MQTVELTGNASIPVMLLLLGIELASVEKSEAFRQVLPGAALKLVAAPILAIGITLGLGLSGTVGRVFVLQAAMPTAITPLALAIEFGNPDNQLTTAEYVGTTILVTTLLSIVSLTGYLLFLTSGLSPI